jgi:hypothetical protein
MAVTMGKVGRTVAWGLAVRGFSEMSGTLDVGAGSLFGQSLLDRRVSLNKQASQPRLPSLTVNQPRVGVNFRAALATRIPPGAGPLEVTFLDVSPGSPARLGSHRKIVRYSGNTSRVQHVSV